MRLPAAHLHSLAPPCGLAYLPIRRPHAYTKCEWLSPLFPSRYETSASPRKAGLRYGSNLYHRPRFSRFICSNGFKNKGIRIAPITPRKCHLIRHSLFFRGRVAALRKCAWPAAITAGSHRSALSRPRGMLENLRLYSLSRAASVLIGTPSRKLLLNLLHIPVQVH